LLDFLTGVEEITLFSIIPEFFMVLSLITMLSLGLIAGVGLTEAGERK
jgi:hypothetical protein